MEHIHLGASYWPLIYGFTYTALPVLVHSVCLERELRGAIEEMDQTILRFGGKLSQPQAPLSSHRIIDVFVSVVSLNGYI